MNRLRVTALLFGMTFSASAQGRLDGCSTPAEPRERPERGLVEGRGLSSDEVSKALAGAGYVLTKESLLSALHDPRPDMRSLAARRLGDGDQTDIVQALMDAWSTEHDPCTRGELSVSLSRIGSSLASHIRDTRGGQRRPSPFQSCVPSEPPLLSLTVEGPVAAASEAQGPVVRVSIRNLTEKPLAIFKQASPADMFSLTVLDPNGSHAKIPTDMDRYYHPASELPPFTAFGKSGPIKPVLEPREETSWDWPVSKDFEVSDFGTYRISLGGRLDYLNTTVCSNTLEMLVGKQ